jgi:tripartite-type tricarboxylate transporter receptor subunit TctC
MIPQSVSRFAAFICMLAIAGAASGQAEFPARALRAIVPFPAGGGTDVLARLIAEKVSARLGQPVIIDNRAGAGGNIGAEVLSKSDPDGYTILFSPPGPLAINPSLYAKLAFDPTRFVPISVVATFPNVLAIRKNLPASSVKELIEYGRRSATPLSFASQGNGTTSHLTAALFQMMTGVKLSHIPYKGGAPAMTDLMSGQVDIMFENATNALPAYRGGRINILGVTGASRLPGLPDVPTVAESGLPGFEATSWVAVVAPAGTPAGPARVLSQAMVAAVHMPDLQKRFAELSTTVVGSNADETGRFLEEERSRWRKVIQSANVSIE